MKKTIIIILALAFVILIAWYWWSSQAGNDRVPLPQAGVILPDDTTGAISEALQDINLEGLENDFQGIDRDLQSL